MKKIVKNNYKTNHMKTHMIKNTTKRILSILLVFCTVLCLAPTAAFAGGLSPSGDGTSSGDGTAPSGGAPAGAESIEVSTSSQFTSIIKDLNDGTKSNVIVTLTADVDTYVPEISRNDIIFSKGTLTILGNDHKLNVSYFALSGSAVLYLGGADYTKTLTMTSSTENTDSIIDLGGNTAAYMYDNVTLCDSKSGGQAAGVFVFGNSKFYMYGGTIKNCINWASAAGGVFVDDNAHFYMYGGLITECEGLSGGGVGLQNNTTFEMSGGTISKCKDTYNGGGGVVIYPNASFIMTGGTIENCTGTNREHGGYGGGILAYPGTGKCEITGSTIRNNSSIYGGGIFAYDGNITVGDGVAIYNNTAKDAGDDIYVYKATLSLGTLPDNLVLEPCTDNIDGWYDDSGEDSTGAQNRWKSHIDEGSADTAYVVPVASGTIDKECGIKAAHVLNPQKKIRIPFTKEVKVSGSSAPKEETFELEIFEPGNSNITDFDDLYTASVTTDGKGTYEGEIIISGPAQDVRDLISKGFYVREVKGNAKNWTYSDAVWHVDPVQNTSGTGSTGSETVSGSEFDFHSAVLETSDNGTYYKISETAADQMVFENVYKSSSDRGDKKDDPDDPDDSHDNITIIDKTDGLLNRDDHFAFFIGYPDKTFGPGLNMTRAEVTTMFARLLTEKIDADKTYPNTFTDVPSDHWASDYIGYMQQLGIINGYEDGSFRPNAPVTRAEFAVIASQFEELTEGTKSFSDVPSTYWAADYINFAATRGWVTGYEDGTFRPTNYITRAEVAAVTCRLLERSAHQSFVRNHINELRTYVDMSENHWAYWYVMEASNGHDYIKVNDNEIWSRIIN